MMRLLSPFSGVMNGKPVFDNTRRLVRLAYRAKYYKKVGFSAVGRIPLLTIARSHFTFLLPESSRPAYLTVEFTNYCNLKCSYCTSPLNLRKRGFMSDETFEVLLHQIKEFDLHRVRIVGNGESTLHPNFAAMVQRLAECCSYLQVVTNGHYLNAQKIGSLLRAPVRLLEVSVDSDNRQGYEGSRIGGNFDRLLTNLRLLKEMRQKLGGPTVVNIRVMIRPSQMTRESEIRNFWSSYADTVMPQYVHDYTRGMDPDVFPHYQVSGLIPRCSVPSKAMTLHWNGTIPLCELSQRQTGMPDG